MSENKNEHNAHIHMYSASTADRQKISSTAGIAAVKGYSFSRHLPLLKQEDMKQLKESVFMYTKKPLYPETKVYYGKQQHVGGRVRKLAIKVLPRNDNSEKEVGLLLSVEHPNIVRVIETGQCFGTVPEIYIAMELCSKNLQEYVIENEKKPFNFDNAFSFSKQLITAVAYIHKNQIVHRDLKPGNILISMDGSKIKVADMGLSKGVGSSQAGAYVTNINAGSEGFKAPETFSTSPTYSYSADIFPLGINVYFIFTNGKHPFGDNPYRWAVNIMDNRDRDLTKIPAFKAPHTERRPQLLQSLEGMLEPIPSKRPTAQQILNDDFSNEATIRQRVAAMTISSESQGGKAINPTANIERIKHLEGELKKPFKEIGYEKSIQLLEELQNLRGSDDLDILLQLAECHLNLMSDKKDSSIANVEHFISTSGSRSAWNVRVMAYDLKQQGHYVQAMILFKISHDLHKKEKKFSPDEELEWISDRFTDITRAITPLAIEGGISRDIAKNYGLKYMNDMLAEVREIKNASPEFKALNELTCLVDIISINGRVGEYGKVIELGEEGTKMMKQHFKEKVSNYKHYGWLLIKLGIAYHCSCQYSKAESCYVTAIEVHEKALDYENEKKRQESIEMTKRNLEEARRLLAKQK